MPLSKHALKKGDTIAVTWKVNPRNGSKYPVIANKTDRGTTLTMIVPVEGPQFPPQPFEKWECTVVDITGKLDGYGMIKVRPERRLVEFDVEDVWVEQNNAKLMLVALQDPECNVMLEGPAGVGKTTLGEALAHKLKAEYRLVAGNAIKKLAQLTGKTNAETKEDKLVFRYAESEFTNAIIYARDNPTKRVFIHLDEVTRMDEDCRDFTLNLLEGKVRKFWVNGEVVEIGTNIIWFASGNVGSSAQFVLKRQDTAYKSRWLIFRVGYMPHAEELKMCLKRNPKCPEKQMDLALKIINAIRAGHMTNSLAIPMGPSPRESLKTAKLLAAVPDAQLDHVLGITVVNQYDGYVESEHSDAGRVARFIIAKLKENGTGTDLLEKRTTFGAH